MTKSSPLKGSKNLPLSLFLQKRELLSKEGSSKNVFSLYLESKEGSFDYLPGDTLALFPQNNPSEVKELISLLSQKGENLIFDPRKKDSLSLERYLLERVNLDHIPLAWIKKASLIDPELLHLLHPENAMALKEWSACYDTLDFLKKYPNLTEKESLATHLSPLLPRFYSITTIPEEKAVGLLIATFEKKLLEKTKPGTASYHLCHKLSIGQEVFGYFQSNPHFRPPEREIPLIMIGPGTGIAPFLSFLKARLEKGATKNWLFFGERSEKSDFYFRDELLEAKDRGLLSLSVAFSRDSEEKIYVQHRMQQEADKLWQWIEDGAHIFICGDAKNMAKDVIHTLTSIAENKKGLTKEGGLAWLSSMRKEGRLKLDVY